MRPVVTPLVLAVAASLAVSACTDTQTEPLPQENIRPPSMAVSVSSSGSGFAYAGGSQGFLFLQDNVGSNRTRPAILLMIGFSCGFDFAMLTNDSYSWSANQAHVSTTTEICQQDIEVTWSRDQGRMYHLPTQNEWYQWPPAFPERPAETENCARKIEDVAHEVASRVGANASFAGTIDGSPVGWDFAYIERSAFVRQICEIGAP